MDLDEIKARMLERGYDQADMANLLGIVPSAISKRLTGKRPFKLEEMRKVEAWLGAEAAVPVAAEGVRMIPMVGEVAAGSWREALQRPMGHWPVAADTAPNSIALRVFGDSMDLEIEDGGTVIVNLDDKALYPGRLYVVLNEAHETTFKQFEIDPARLVPRSSNPAHQPILIGDGQAFTVVGRVTALNRAR